MRFFFCLMMGMMLVAGTQAQWNNRSGQNDQVRTAAVAQAVACGGTTIFEEDFENGLPAGWTIVDGDTATPRPQMLLGKGWQSHQDYNDSTNHLMVTPSWYVNTAQSDDWLITPQITLGANPCLSWTSYSQDFAFPETFEVRISTTTADTNAFLADTAYVTIAGEQHDPNVHAVSLLPWAGQSIYIAFRQTSDDAFVLALDDVKVSNVFNVDIGVIALDFPITSPGDTIGFNMEVANFGSDTITSFDVAWSANGGPMRVMSIDTISIAPNDKVLFTHDTTFATDTLDGFVDVCAWTLAPNGGTDDAPSNDTLCGTLTVGAPVGVPSGDFAEASMTVFPNPFSDDFAVQLSDLRGKHTVSLVLTDLTGRIVYRSMETITGSARIDVRPGALAPGVYVLQLHSQGKRIAGRKLIKH